MLTAIVASVSGATITATFIHCLVAIRRPAQDQAGENVES